jgi:ATP-dependent helicase HrpB
MYPVLEVLAELQTALENHPIVILQAPPGAGKSTVLPVHLYGQPWLQGQKIIMLEPRRLAARSVASRLAHQLKEPVGKTVGYRVRFDSLVSKETSIEVVTEGILTRQLQNDNALEGVGLIVFDEFHERSLHADLSLALCLQLQQVLRPDLKILIMSATLDAEVLAPRLNRPPVITSLGKMYPVTIIYEEPDKDLNLITHVARTIQKAMRSQSGDILVFLPGVNEILRTQAALEPTGITVAPLYGDMPLQQQQEVLQPRAHGERRVVLATSIAETSLTIEGIQVVIDSGYSRVPRFDPRSGLTRLETVRVTQDAADQRAGRAGRMMAGVCYRLWPQYLSLVPQRKPEILEADLAPLMLELAQWGVREIHELTWITAPPTGAVNQAINLLHQLNALHDGKITAQGKAMLQLPTHPRIAHLLAVAKELDLSSLACDLAAVLEERDPLPRGSGADVMLRIETLRKWRSGVKVNAERQILERVERLAAHWRKQLRANISNDMPAAGQAGQLLIQAYPERLAKQLQKRGERFKLVNGRIALLPSGDELMMADWICAAQLDAGTNEGKIFLAAAVSEEDLIQGALEISTVRWDEDREAVVAITEKRMGTRILSSKPSGKIDEDKKNEILVAQIRQQGLVWAGWTEEEQKWQARVMSMQKWRPDQAWPDVSDSTLLATIDIWLIPFLTGVIRRSDLRKLDWNSIAKSLMTYQQQRDLDTLAPMRLQVPSGSSIMINYFSDGQTPVMQVRLQEMFGLLETPVINEGRIRLMLHLLSPGYKPVQVTQDLRSFWQTTYHEVRKELRMRYPRHSWPDDPFTAEAVRGAKKRT